MSTQAAGGAASAHNAMIKIVENGDPAPPPVEQPEPEAITDGEEKEQ